MNSIVSLFLITINRMYSWLGKYLEDTQITYTGFRNIKVVIYALLIIACSRLFLKYALNRRNLMKAYPSRKVNFFNPWGNLIDLIKCAKIEGINLNVYILQILLGHQQLQKDENFFYLGLGYFPYIIITRAKAVEELISGSKNMEKNWMYSLLHPWLQTGLLTSHGSKWKSRRKLLTPTLHFDILKEFLPIFNKQSQLLVDKLHKETKRPWTDIVEPITLCSLDIICETILGVSTGAQKDSESEYVQAVSRASETVMKRASYPPYILDWYFFLTREGFQFKKDVKLLHDFTHSVIADKKRKLLNSTQAINCKKRKALMDLLLEEHLNNILSEEDIREEVDTFAFEGHDTTSMGMSWALYLIGLHNDVQEKIHEEIDLVFGNDYERPVTTEDLTNLGYLERVLKESQRLYPSVPVFGRNLSEDTVLCGFKVPKEVGIFILPYILHRDETVFPNPEKFNPDRFLPENSASRSPFAYIPFSVGPRNCIDLLQTFSGYTQLFRKESFFCFWFAFVPFVYVIKARAVEQLISGTKHLQKAWTYNWVHDWLNFGLLTSHGLKWKTRRKLITPSFHFEILKDFLPLIDEQSRYLVEKVFRKETDKDWTDVTMPLTLCTLDIICETTLGVSVNAQKNSKSEYVQALMRVGSIVMRRLAHPAYFIDAIFNFSKLGREFKSDVKLLHQFTRSVIKEKKAKLKISAMPTKRKALMDVLLEHHLQNENLTEEDIREEVDTFTFAGHDTTSMGISWALYLIGLHKDVQSQLHEETDRIFGEDTDRPVTNDDLKEMEYLERVLKESQRLYPSVPMFGRTATAETVLNGYKIPEGTTCLIYTYELHRDPEEFPDPEKFCPNRFLPENSINRHPYAFVPFSAGARNCIGQRFALMEEKVIVTNILRNFTLESLEPRDKVFPAPEIILRNSEPLKIRIRERIR